MFALKRSVFRPTLTQRVKSLASSTAKILRFPARQEVVGADPARRLRCRFRRSVGAVLTVLPRTRT